MDVGTSTSGRRPSSVLAPSSDALVTTSKAPVTTSVALVTTSFLFLIASLLLVVRPGAPSSVLAPSSFCFS